MPELATKQGSKLKVLEDNSVLVTENVDSNEDYTVTVPLPAGTHYALRLEGLKHESLHNGLFSTSISGDYRVTTIEVELNGEKVKLIEPQTNVTGAMIPIRRSTATSARASRPASPRNRKTRPSGSPASKSRSKVDNDAKLVIRLRNESVDSYAPIGRFRVVAHRVSHGRPLQKNLGLPADSRCRPIDACRRAHGGTTQAQLAALARAHLLLPLRDKIREIEKQIAAEEAGFLKTMVMRDRTEPRETYLLEARRVGCPRQERAACIPTCRNACRRCPKMRRRIAWRSPSG